MTTNDLVSRLRDARVVDLAQTLHAEMPQLHGAPRFHLSLLRRHGDLVRGEGYSAANELLSTICHAGTHIDAIGHVSVDGLLYGDRSADEVQRGTRGLRELGIETVEPIVRRGILADVAGHLGVPALDPAFGISGDLLSATLEATGRHAEPGDVILVRTGWGRFWDDPERYVSRAAGLPGINDDGAAWIARAGAFATGSDTLMYEAVDPRDDRMRVHSRLIRRESIHLIENMNLETLAGQDAFDFVVVILPLRLVGATGSQVRPIAIL